MKICVACSAGGHLTEALQIMSSIRNNDIFFYTFFVKHLKSSLKKHKVYYTVNPKRNPLLLLRVLFSSFLVLLKERPKVIISTGANVTVPISILGKILFGCKLIYIDCAAQVYKPSITGKILYNFADLFFVQWKSLLKCYGKKAIYGGLLI